MKRIGIIGLCFAAVLAFSMLTVASASATELLVSSGTGTFEGTSGVAELVAASKIKCLTSSTRGTIETAHLGKLEVRFKKCTTELLGSHECTGTKPLSPEKGTIIFEGTFHLNLAQATAPHAAILILAPLTEFSCAGVGTGKVEGTVVGLLQTKAGAPLVPEEELLHSVFVFKATTPGGRTQEDKEFLLALTTPPNERMPNQELTSEIFGIKSETAEIVSDEVTNVSPAGTHLVTG